MREALGTLFAIVFDLLVVCFVVWMFQDLPVWLAAIPSVLLVAVGAVATYCVARYWISRVKENGKS